MPNEYSDFIVEQASLLLEAAVRLDDETTAEVLGAIVERHGHRGVYSLCVCLADTVRQIAFNNQPRGDGTLTGPIVVVEQYDHTDLRNTGDLWASRFVSSYINGDDETTKSLFTSSITDVATHVGGVTELICMAADVTRQRLNENRDRESRN